MNFFKFFKRRYPYAPIAFLGRKNVEKMLGADIKKLKKVEKMNQVEDQNASGDADDLLEPTVPPKKKKKNKGKKSKNKAKKKSDKE